MAEPFQQLDTALTQAKTALVTAHISPDGDGIGSILAFAHGLKQGYPQIQTIDCLVTGKVPDSLEILPGIETIRNLDKASTPEMRYDIAVCMDSGDAARLGKAQALFESAGTTVNIDHHISNERFAAINVIDIAAAATGQVVADFLAWKKIPLTRETAVCIYTTLLADTGGFQYSNTTAAVFELAAKLLAAGVTPDILYKNLITRTTRAQVELHADVLSTAQFSADGKIAWACISRKQLANRHALDEHIDGVVETLRNIDTVLASAVFKETLDGATKVSLRSDTQAIDVATIAGKFGGGGHKMAAGCTINRPPETAAKDLIPLLEKAADNA